MYTRNIFPHEYKYLRTLKCGIKLSIIDTVTTNSGLKNRADSGHCFVATYLLCPYCLMLVIRQCRGNLMSKWVRLIR